MSFGLLCNHWLSLWSMCYSRAGGRKKRMEKYCHMLSNCGMATTHLTFLGIACLKPKSLHVNQESWWGRGIGTGGIVSVLRTGRVSAIITQLFLLCCRSRVS